MRTEHVKTERGLFDFDDLIERVEAPVLNKTKKKKERIPFYIKALDKLNTNPKVKAKNTVAECTTTIDDSVVHDNTLRFTEDPQLSQPKQPSEGSYESIWKKPRIRPNADFEENLDEEFLFEDDDEELDCAVEAQPIKIDTSIFNSYYIKSGKYPLRPKTQPSSAPEEAPQEEVPENILKAKAVQEEQVEEEDQIGEKTYIRGASGEYVEVVDDLNNAMHKIKKSGLLGSIEDIELLNASLNLKEATKMHKNITDEPINEV